MGKEMGIEWLNLRPLFLFSLKRVTGKESMIEESLNICMHARHKAYFLIWFSSEYLFD